MMPSSNSLNKTTDHHRPHQRFEQTRSGEVDAIDKIRNKIVTKELRKKTEDRTKFDGHLHFFYLKNPEKEEDLDPLLELLERRHEGVIHFHLPQLCRLAIENSERKPDAEGRDPINFGRFISSKSANSMHFALKADWCFRAISEDKQTDQESKIATWLSEKIETAVVNAVVTGRGRTFSEEEKQQIEGSEEIERLNPKSTLSRSASKCSIEEPTPQMLEPNLRQRIIAAIPHQSAIPDDPSLPDSWGANSKTQQGIPFFTNTGGNKCIDSIWSRIEHPAETCRKMKTHSIDSELIWFLSKQIRCDYFAMTGKFCSYLIEISDCLANEPERSERMNLAAKCFLKINHWIFCRRAIVAACELTFCMKGFCIPMDRIGPDPEIWSETGKELRTEWDDRVVEVVNNPNWEEVVQHTPNAVQILKIASKECKVLSSAKRAPYLLVMETGDLDEDVRDLVSSQINTDTRIKEALAKMADNNASDPANFMVDPSESQLPVTRDNKPRRPYSWNDLYTYDCVLADIESFNLYIPRTLNKPVNKSVLTKARTLIADGVNVDSIEDEELKNVVLDLLTPEAAIDAIRRSLRLFNSSGDSLSPSTSTRRASIAFSNCDNSPVESPKADPFHLNDPKVDSTKTTGTATAFPCPADMTTAEWAPALRKLLWGESWYDKKTRLRAASPYGKLKSWDLHAVLVKGGDDLRQEFLAQQLIRVFRTIFEENGIPLWLRPYEILVTGPNSGIMEFVPDSSSFGALKQKYGNENFARFFEAAFADNLELAQLNFVHSYAAYSVVSYILNVKDRHNGNLLLLNTGHCIHIDFGFMLNSAPGGQIANLLGGGPFESCAFKLTSEIMEIFEGPDSDLFEYFRRLIIYGFIGVRNHASKLLQLVEMMQSHRKMPCFAGDPRKSLEDMRARLLLGTADDEAIAALQEHISVSINNWRTTQYDNYQKTFNKIW